MSVNIEWVKPERPVLIGGDDQMADGNTANENGHKDYIGITWGGQAILYGSPVEVLKALADAALLVAQHLDDSE
jgi:hypothetical protein